MRVCYPPSQTFRVSSLSIETSISTQTSSHSNRKQVMIIPLTMHAPLLTTDSFSSVLPSLLFVPPSLLTLSSFTAFHSFAFSVFTNCSSLLLLSLILYHCISLSLSMSTISHYSSHLSISMYPVLSNCFPVSIHIFLSSSIPSFSYLSSFLLLSLPLHPSIPPSLHFHRVQLYSRSTSISSSASSSSYQIVSFA